MTFTKQDLAILSKFDFPVKPVAVGFLVKRPDGVDRLDENMSFCAMLKRAREGSPFYAGPENHTCEAGPYLLGMEDALQPYISGQFGAALKIFKTPRAARRLYFFVPKLQKNSINYVAFSTLDRLSFEPDVLVLAADASQAEILLRAMSYTTGKMWSSKFTAAVGCAWTLIYPYVTGELNYTITGFGTGMKARKVFPEGLVLISIPFELLPSILRNLQDMPWVLPTLQPGAEEFRKRVRIELGLEPSP